MSSVTHSRGSVGIVSEEKVIVAVAGVLGARVAEHVARRELIKREQHVVHHRVPDGRAFGE